MWADMSRRVDARSAGGAVYVSMAGRRVGCRSVEGRLMFSMAGGRGRCKEC
jgi:hypothetical protein